MHAAMCNVRTTTTTGGSPARALGLASTPCHCQLGRRLVIIRLSRRQLRCVSFLCASCVLRFHTYARLCSVLALLVFFVRRLKDAFSWHCVALHVLCLLRVLLQPPPRLRQEWGGVSSCHRAAATEMASTIIIITETAVVQGAEATPFITLHAIAIMVAAASSTPPAVAVAAAASHRKRIGPLAAYRYVPYACLPACMHARV